MINPHIVRKATDPVSAPPEAGIHWINTVTGTEFFSVGTSSVGDWIARITGSSVVAATTVTNETTYGITPVVGTATTYAREDHTHGTMSTPTKTTVGLSNVDNTSDATKDSAVSTLTNKTLTSPIINSPTGIVKADVGLSNVDNTSDATKNSAAVSLTNHTIDATLNTITNLKTTDITSAHIIGSPTDMLTLDRVLDHAWSAGVTDGAMATNNGDGTINLSSANVVLRQSLSTTLTRLGSTVTAIHPADTYLTGDNVYIYGATQPEYNGKYVINVLSSTSFTYQITGTPTTPATGTIVSVNEHAKMQIMTVPAVTNLTFTDHAVTFVYVDYNAGTPTYATTQTISTFDGLDKVIAYKIAREGTTLYITDARAFNVDGLRKNGRRLIETQGFQHAQGGSVISHIGTRNLNVTPGAFYYGVNKILHNAFNTSSTDTFTYTYRNGSGGYTYTSGNTQISNTLYDNGTGTLATLSNGNYGVFTVYMMVDSPCTLMVQYGSGNYNTLAQAQAATIIAPPPIVSGVGVLLGRIIILKNAAVFADISSAFATQFTPTTANDHELLAGLLGGAANDHYHITAVEAAVVANTSGINTGDQTALTVSNTPAGGIAATNVQAAINELDTEKANLASPTFTGTVSGVTKAMVGLGNVDNTSDATKNSAVATLTNKTLTSPVINSPTGIVKADVGLSNVDNTSDATKNSASVTLTNKALSDSTTSIVDVTDVTKKILFDAAGTTATSTTLLSSQTANRILTLPDITDTLVGQTALNLKANIASPTFTGTVSGITAAMVGAPSGSGTSSGTNTGDQTITLTGGVTGSGTGSFVATVVTNANLTGGVTSVGNATTVVTNANLTGVITSTGNATSIASQTGTGTKFVVDNSPTLITPNLGTPTTLVGTNITGTATSFTASNVTTNANLTGPVTSVGNATSITAAAVTNTMLANMATKTYKGRTTAGTGVPEDVSVATLKTDLALTKSDVGLGSVVNADTTTTANITDSTNKRFVTDANLTTIGNQSGTNTGDQTLSDATISVTDITTNNVTNSAHGFFPKITGTAGQFVKVNAGGTGLDYATISGGGDLLSTNNLSDVANVVTTRNNILPSKTGNSLKVLRVNSGETDYEVATISGGGTTVYTSSNEVDFGTNSDYAILTVSAAWITTNSILSFSIAPNLTDHDIEDALLEGLTCTYANLIVGTSFDIHVHAPNETWGRYLIKTIGIA